MFSHFYKDKRKQASTKLSDLVMNPSTASKSKPGGRKASMAATASIVVEKDENSDKMTGGDQEETILHEIRGLKTELLKEIDEKAEKQAIEIRTQCDELREEFKTAMDQAGTKTTCCNLYIIGVKERRENGKHAPEFVSQLLKDTLGLEKAPLLDCAHRTLTERPGEDQPARAFVVRCHFIQEREMLIKKAIQKKEIITPDGDRIRIQPNYTQKVAKQRAAFNEVRGELRQVEGVRYGLFYPAELRITAKDGTRRNFNDAKLAMDFVKRTLKS